MSKPSHNESENQEAWLPIKSAPKNPEGTAYGPWILIWYEYSHTPIAARWEASNGICRWVPKHDRNFNSIGSQHRVTHWKGYSGPDRDSQ